MLDRHNIELPDCLHYRQNALSNHKVTTIYAAAKALDKTALRYLIKPTTDSDDMDLVLAKAIFNLAKDKLKESVYLLIDNFGGDSEDAAYSYAFHGHTEELQELQWHYRQSSQMISPKIMALGFIFGKKDHLVKLLLAEKPHLIETVIAIYRDNQDEANAEALTDAVAVKKAVEVLKRVANSKGDGVQAQSFKLFYSTLAKQQLMPGPVVDHSDDVCKELHAVEASFQRKFNI